MTLTRPALGFAAVAAFALFGGTACSAPVDPALPAPESGSGAAASSSSIDVITTAACPQVRQGAIDALDIPDFASGLIGF